VNTRTRVGVLAVVGFALTLLGPNVRAQAVSFHPGSTVTIDVAFDGKDASEISTVVVWLNLTTPVKDGQEGFQKQWSGQARKVGDAFEASFAVDDNQAAGTYQVNQIRALTNQSAQSDFYYLISEFPGTTFKIDNSRTVEKPKVRSLTVH
jgi:hypothetical protein